MRLNSAGISMNTSWYVSGLTIINNATTISSTLNVSGVITNGTTSYIYAGGLRLGGFDTGNTIWQDTGDLGISSNVNTNIIFNIGNGGEKMRIKSNGCVGIGTNDPKCHLQVNGIGSINNGSPYAPINNFMQSGSLTIASP